VIPPITNIPLISFPKIRPAMKHALALTFLSITAIACAGGVSGRVVVEGDVPAAEPLPPGKDVCCQKAGPVDESVVVGPDGGLANVFVSVEPRRGEPQPPAASKVPSEPASLTNHGCAFAPRALVVRVGQPLVLANSDPTMHNVDIDFVRNRAVNVVVEPDGERRFELTKPESRPVAVRCNVHTYMRAWVMVRDNPYAAVTDKTGRFELPDLPPGEWRLRFWREGQPMVGLKMVGLAVGDGTTDDRGEAVLTVPDDGLDLGDLKVTGDTLR
jgi:plastocyanin